LKLLAQQTE